MEKKIIAQAAKDILRGVGEDLNREGLRDTPERMAKSFEKLFSGYDQDPSEVIREFDSEDYDQMIICKKIDFFSMCEHHMLPFFGQASVGYIPNKKIIGVSKMPRLVEIFSRRLQNQERLTKQIADTLSNLIKPLGVGVVIEAQHLCMMSRGVEKQNAIMNTSSFAGIFKKNSKTRNEFLQLIK